MTGNYDKKIYDLLTKPLPSDLSARSLGRSINDSQNQLSQGGAVYDAVITDASGSNLAADIATILGYLEATGDIHDVLYADAVGASLAVDIAAILTDTDEMQIDWVNGGRLDLLIDELTTQGDTNETKLNSIIAVTEAGEATGTFSYLDAGGEQTILEQTISTRREIKSIHIDTVNLTQNGTLKIHHKIYGTNYRELTPLQVAFTVASDDGIIVLAFTVNNDWKMTWTEGVDEGANRDILYNVIYQELE